MNQLLFVLFSFIAFHSMAQQKVFMVDQEQIPAEAIIVKTSSPWLRLTYHEFMEHDSLVKDQRIAIYFDEPTVFTTPLTFTIREFEDVDTVRFRQHTPVFKEP